MAKKKIGVPGAPGPAPASDFDVGRLLDPSFDPPAGPKPPVIKPPGTPGEKLVPKAQVGLKPLQPVAPGFVGPPVPSLPLAAGPRDIPVPLDRRPIGMPTPTAEPYPVRPEAGPFPELASPKPKFTGVGKGLEHLIRTPPAAAPITPPVAPVAPVATAAPAAAPVPGIRGIPGRVGVAAGNIGAAVRPRAVAAAPGAAAMAGLGLVAQPEAVLHPMESLGNTAKGMITQPVEALRSGNAKEALRRMAHGDGETWGNFGSNMADSVVGLPFQAAQNIGNTVADAYNGKLGGNLARGYDRIVENYLGAGDPVQPRPAAPGPPPAMLKANEILSSGNSGTMSADELNALWDKAGVGPGLAPPQPPSPSVGIAGPAAMPNPGVQAKPLAPAAQDEFTRLPGENQAQMYQRMGIKAAPGTGVEMAGGDSDRFDKYYNDKFLNELRFRGMNGDNESAKLYLMHMNGGIVPDALKAELDSKERMDAARNAAEIKAAEVRGQGMGPGAEIEALMRMPPEQLGIIERLRGLAPGSLSKPAAPGALGSIPPDASLSQVRGAIEQGGLMDGEGGMGQVRDFMNERFPGQVREQYESMQPGFMGRHGLSPWGREDADANMRLLERLFPEMFNPATAQ